LAKHWEKDPAVTARILRYGTNEQADFSIVDRRFDKSSSRQRVRLKSPQSEVSFSSSMSGEYNAINLAAAYAVGDLIGLDSLEIIGGLEKFSGVKRRQQEIWRGNDIIVLEDFAHHPTAVQVTLAGIREAFPDKRIIAIYEPRSNTSRRAFFQNEYLKAFAAADVVYIREVQAGSNYSNTGEHEFLDTKALVSALQDNGLSAATFSEIEPFVSSLVATLKAQDLVVLMSNGDFGGLPAKLPLALKHA